MVSMRTNGQRLGTYRASIEHPGNNQWACSAQQVQNRHPLGIQWVTSAYTLGTKRRPIGYPKTELSL